MLKIKTLSVGLLGANCYLVFSGRTNILYVIDPGGDAEQIISEAKKIGYRQAIILLTHGHVDHITATGEVMSRLKAGPVYLREADITLYASPANAIPPFVPAARNLPSTTGRLTGAEFKILPAPGHTPGSALFYFPEDRALFSGDVLFAGSVGRTDLPGGDWEELQKSIREQILSLPDEVAVYPGHGPATTVGRERSGNPFLRPDSSPET